MTMIAISMTFSIVSVILRTVFYLLALMFSPSVLTIGLMFIIYHRLFTETNYLLDPTNEEGDDGDTNGGSSCLHRRRRRGYRNCRRRSRGCQHTESGQSDTGFPPSERTTGAETTTPLIVVPEQGNYTDDTPTTKNIHRQKVSVRAIESDDNMTFLLDVAGFTVNNIEVTIKDDDDEAKDKNERCEEEIEAMLDIAFMPRIGTVGTVQTKEQQKQEQIVVVRGERTNHLGDTYIFEEKFVLDMNKYDLKEGHVQADMLSEESILEIKINKKPQPKPHVIPILTTKNEEN